jgi:hypothetical protein
MPSGFQTGIQVRNGTKIRGMSPRTFSNRVYQVCLAGALLAAVACGPTVDLTHALQVQDVSTGWVDGGDSDGQNKLVPLVRFKLKNSSDQKLPVLQVNAVFRPVNDEKEWGTRFQAVTGSEGLSAGATTQELTVKSDHGVTGSDPKPDLLKNSHFVDARVQLFAKYGSIGWVRIGDAEYPVARQLINN